MSSFVMDPEFVEYFKAYKAEEKRCIVPGLLQNLEHRSLGLSKRNVSSKEYRELIAEESLVRKEKFDELHCEMPGVPRSTFLMVFSPDGTKVASTHGNHNIYVTDIRTGKNLKTLVGHPRTPWCIAFHPTSNQIIASGCLGGQVRIWDLSGGSEVWTAKNQTVIASIAFHPLERILVIATSNDVYFWDWSKPDPFMQTSTGSPKEKVRYVAFDKLGQRLITGISNSHSRWDYVRSSDRASEHPVRHFNIASRRPVFRRGLLPTRQSVSLSSTSNGPPETRSRVPERERNITMSYRNLVRQYGRLVQRYLQLYRPPAMIDRGTDPMENTANLNNTAEDVVPSGSADNALPSGSAENASPADSSENVRLSNSSTSAGPSSSAKKSRPSVTVENEGSSGSAGPSGPVKKMRLIDSLKKEESSGGTTNSSKSECSCSSPASTSTTTSDSSANPEQNEPAENVGPSGFAGEDPAPSNRKHKNDSPPQNNIPQKKLKINAGDSNEQPTTRSHSPQPGPSGLSEAQSRTDSVRELSRAIIASLANLSKTSANSKTRKTGERSENNQNSSAQTEDFAPSDNEIQHSVANLEELVSDLTEDSNAQDNQTDDEDILVNHDLNGISANEDVENGSENNQRPAEDSQENTAGNLQSVETSRDESSVSRDPYVERIYNQMIRTLGTLPGEILRSRLNQMSDVDAAQSPEVAQEVVDVQNLTANAEEPGPSGVSGRQLQPGEDRRLENMMMEMRRKAEDNLRARLFPLLSSRVPENRRNDLIRLFEASIRESRERARVRYRLMVQMYNEQPNREQLFTSSDSSSSEEGRDPLHMNFHIDSTTDNTAGATNNDSEAMARRENAFSGGNNSYQNINNLESWVTSLFSDANSTSMHNELDTLSNMTSRSMNDLLEIQQSMVDTSNSRDADVNISLSTTGSSSPESPQNTSMPERSTDTRTSRNLSSTRRQNQMSARSPSTAARTETYTRRGYLSPRLRRQAETLGARLPPNPAPDNNFARDEVINFSELPNSENPAPDRSEDFHSTLQPTFHPFNPPPNLPAINPENIGIGNMYSNIVHDLEASLSNARNRRTLDRPGEMSNMLSSFSNRLQTLMNQSEEILRNLRTSVEVLPDSDTLEYGEDPPMPTASFNDSSFFVRDQGSEGAGSERGSNNSSGYQSNATSDHTYPRNSESASASSNLNGSMSPLMNSLHLTLSHIQVQSRLLHRQVESIERIDRAMVEVSQIQLMRLLLGELTTYVRNMSGESRSTSMSSVRQMMAGTRISDSSPGNAETSGDSDSNASANSPRPSTSAGSRSANQNSSARNRGLFRKTYPPSRLYRVATPSSERNTREDSSSESTSPLPTSAPTHTFSIITIPTLVRMERRLQAIIDDHARRFSYLTQLITSRSNNPRRLVHGLGEHNVALRLRESINRINRLLGNIFDSNIIRNYRVDASTSLRHGINRYYERTFLSLIIDGLSSYLDENVDHPIPPEARTRMQSVLQLAMMMADLLLLYTLISLSPTSEVNLDSERRLLASRIEETCSTIICSRRCSNIFVQSLRNLRLMVSVHCESPASNPTPPSQRRTDMRTLENSRLWRSMRARYAAQSDGDPSSGTNNAQAETRESNDSNANNPMINACLYVARRIRAEISSTNALTTESNTHQNRRARYRVNNPRENNLFNAYVYLSRRQRSLNNAISSGTQNDDDANFRRRNTADLADSEYLTAGNAQSLNSAGAGSQQSVGRSSLYESRRNRSGFNPYRDIELITTRAAASPSSADNSADLRRSNDAPSRHSSHRTRGRNRTLSESAEHSANQMGRGPRRSAREQEASSSSIDFRWLNNTIEPFPAELASEREAFFNPSSESRVFEASLLPASLSPLQSRPSTSNNSEPSSSRFWRIPAVQVNDVPVSDLAAPLENSDSEASSNTGTNSSNSNYPRVMARLASFRSHMPFYNPMGVLRPRLLHPLYSALNPFDADLEQREHIYDSDVISTVTPNHRIQIWDISNSVIPKISDPLKNLVVRECKIHNDASVDIASDGSILVTLLPSGGYLNITNRLGIYSLRWETLGQCLYTTSFVHNAVSVSLSPLGRHLVVALASRRVSILPNDRWMMASIYKIEEKETRGDNLPFVRQIERGRNEPTSHKSVNCIRWLPTSGQGLIYATNTGQLNIWT